MRDGRADAFRHAYWNALGTAEFGSNITQIFTDAHEAYSRWSYQKQNGFIIIKR